MLESLLVTNPEPLLLVHDEESEPRQFHVLREQAVGPDDDVDLTGIHPREKGLLFLRRPEATQGADLHRIVGQPLLEGVAVLLHQHRCGCKERDLLPILDRLESGPDRDLGLAVSHIPADQPIHGSGRFHVALDVLRCQALVRRVLVEERGLHLFSATVCRARRRTPRQWSGERTIGEAPPSSSRWLEWSCASASSIACRQCGAGQGPWPSPSHPPTVRPGPGGRRALVGSPLPRIRWPSTRAACPRPRLARGP